MYVFKSAFDTRLDSFLHSVGGFTLYLVCTNFSLPENRKKGNDSAFIKLGEEDLVLIDWIGLVYVRLVQMHHFYNKWFPLHIKFSKITYHFYYSIIVSTCINFFFSFYTRLLLFLIYY